MVRYLLMLLPVLTALGCRTRVSVKTPQEFQQVVEEVGVVQEKKQRLYCFQALVKFESRFIVWSGCTPDWEACVIGQRAAVKFGDLGGAKNVTECATVDVAER